MDDTAAAGSCQVIVFPPTRVRQHPLSSPEEAALVPGRGCYSYCWEVGWGEGGTELCGSAADLRVDNVLQKTFLWDALSCRAAEALLVPGGVGLVQPGCQINESVNTGTLMLLLPPNDIHKKATFEEQDLSPSSLLGGGTPAAASPEPSWGSAEPALSSHTTNGHKFFSAQPKLSAPLPPARGCGSLQAHNAISVYSAAVPFLRLLPQQHSCSPAQSFSEPGLCRC